MIPDKLTEKEKPVKNHKESIGSDISIDDNLIRDKGKQTDPICLD